MFPKSTNTILALLSNAFSKSFSSLIAAITGFSMKTSVKFIYNTPFYINFLIFKLYSYFFNSTTSTKSFNKRGIKLFPIPALF